MEVKVIGQMDNTIDHTFESANRVYDVGGISPTINTCGGGGLQPKILDKPKCLNSKGGRAGIDGLQPSLQDRVYGTDAVSVAVTTSFMPSILEEKTIVAMRGRVQDMGDTCPTLMAGESDICRIEKANFVIGGLQEHQTPRTDGISPSLTAAMGMGGGQTPLINCQYRIRKLTPIECWRLMDFSDEDFLSAKLGNREVAKEILKTYPHLGKRAFTEVQRLEKNEQHATLQTSR